MKKGENLFIVDLTTVSIFNEEYLKHLAQREKEYQKTPFLYLLFSYARNYSINWANKNLNYADKRKKGSWIIYKFVY